MWLEYVIDMCGFLGAWLLFAGPIWQAMIELQEEEIDQEGIEAARAATKHTPSYSRWWWLFPPAAYILRMREARAERKEFNDALQPEQLRQTVSFLNKANGWLIVAAGAFLIAVKESWQLVQLLDWPIWIFWVAIVVLPIAGIANALLRQMSSRKLLEQDAAAQAKYAQAELPPAELPPAELPPAETTSRSQTSSER